MTLMCKRAAWSAILILKCLCSCLPAQTNDGFDPSPAELEKQLIALVNCERTGCGLPELQSETALSELARAHSRKMIQERTLAHDFPGYPQLDIRMADARLYFHTVAENVARAPTSIPAVIHQALLDSPRHRVNILSPAFRQIGVGIVFDGESFLVTQLFADLIMPSSATRAAGQLAAPPPRIGGSEKSGKLSRDLWERLNQYRTVCDQPQFNWNHTFANQAVSLAKSLLFAKTRPATLAARKPASDPRFPLYYVYETADISFIPNDLVVAVLSTASQDIYIRIVRDDKPQAPQNHLIVAVVGK